MKLLIILDNHFSFNDVKTIGVTSGAEAQQNSKNGKILTFEKVIRKKRKSSLLCFDKIAFGLNSPNPVQSEDQSLGHLSTQLL